MIKKPIIIDTDPGVDDFFCLMMAQAHSDILDIRALTTICGNNYTEVTTRNCLDIAKVLGMDTKIAMGAEKYIMEPYGEPVVSAHGSNGVAEVAFTVSDQKIEEKYAWDVIYDEAVKCAGELEIVPVGPLTNIAIAIIKYPKLKNLIKGITIMGGSTFVGNYLPLSEANVGHDAYAADIVFKSGIPITMVGLNVTEKCEVKLEEALKHMNDMPDELYYAVETMINFRSGEALHDAVAVALLVNPEMGEFKDYYVSVETLSPVTKGQTIVDFNNVTGNDANTSVAMEIDAVKYRKMFCDMLEYFKR